MNIHFSDDANKQYSPLDTVPISPVLSCIQSSIINVESLTKLSV